MSRKERLTPAQQDEVDKIVKRYVDANERQRQALNRLSRRLKNCSCGGTEKDPTRPRPSAETDDEEFQL